MKDLYKEIATVIVLLIPLSFVLWGGYLQQVTGYLYLFIIQGYVAWFLLFRSGQPFFGYSVTMAMGAYGTIVLTEIYKWPLLISALVGSGMATLISVGVFFGTSRAKGFYVGMTSFLLALLFPMVVEGTRDISGGRSGIYFTRPDSLLGPDVLYLLIVFLTALIAAGLFAFMRTKTGTILTLISENDELSQTVGINTIKYKALSYGIAGFLSGVGGALYVNYNGFISSIDVDAFTTLYIYFIPLLGGRKSSYGPLIGALIVIMVPELLLSIERYLRIIMGVVFILVITFLPEGVGPSIENILNRIISRFRAPSVTV
ncbi:MAG: branched-chain amino acid ABC transporter permease [Deltaproteobacteria bacterium]|nr:branched-chain amino acid ABC transporter permease [Deltaproteobacteria bacterium]